MASAKTILVNRAGTDNAETTLSTAVAKSAPGDTIVITDSSEYWSPTNLTLNGVTLRGQINNPKATIKISAFFDVHNSTVENLNFKMNFGWGPGIRCWGDFKLSRLFITDKDGDHAPILVDPKAGEVTKGTMEYVTTYNGKTGQHVIQFGGGWNSDATTNKVTTSDVGPILINHCTITYPDGYATWVDPSWPNDGENITVKNSILGIMTPTDCWVSVIFGALDRATAPKINHSYNLYTNIWIFEGYGFTNPPANGVKDPGTSPDKAKHEIGGGFTWTNPFNFLFSSAGYYTGKVGAAPWEGNMVLDSSVGGSYKQTLVKGGVTTQTLTQTASPNGVAVTPQVVVTDAVDFDLAAWTSVSVVLTGTDAAGADQTETVAATASADKKTWTAKATKTFLTLTKVETTVTPSSVSDNDTEKGDTVQVGYVVTPVAALTPELLKLAPKYSPALWQADDGLHMGADVTTVPVELSTFDIQ